MIFNDSENTIINGIDTFIEKSKNKKQSIYIYRAANAGKMVAGYLRKRNIDVDAFLVDDGYFKSDVYILGIPVVRVKDKAYNKENTTVLVAMGNPNKDTLKYLSENTVLIDGDFMSLWSPTGEPLLDMEYLKCKEDLFNETRDMLCDEKSRMIMDGFIEAKICGNFRLRDLYEDNQYFPRDLYDIAKIKGFVDAGAYTGDTFEDFCNAYLERTGKEYNHSAYLFEPEKNNVLRMNQLAQTKARIFQVGLWNENDSLRISSDEDISVISDTTGESVRLQRLDEVLKGKKIDFIKMDIEGAELNALKGAESIISNYHPILAISIYHKREDLFSIPQYIRKLYPGYKLYIRAHMPSCVDVVLYAIP